MSELSRRWLWLLLCAGVTACATMAPSAHTGVAGCEASGEENSFEEACAKAGSLLALCDGERCALYPCQEVAEHLTAGQVVRTKGGSLSLPRPPGSAMRYWGRAQQLPWTSQPVFLIPWGPRPPQELLPSQKLLLEEQKAQRGKPYEMHHIFPREFKEWFDIKGIDIDQHTMPLEVEEHRRIHRGAQGGPWNAAWRKYVLGNAGAFKPEIEKYAGQLIYEFGLYGIVVPYRPRVLPLPTPGVY